MSQPKHARTPKRHHKVTRTRETVLLEMSLDVAELVADALDIVNPDDERTEALARRIALDLREE